MPNYLNLFLSCVKPIFHLANLFARSEKQILAMWLVGEKTRREKVGSVPTFLLFARTNSRSGKWALFNMIWYTNHPHLKVAPHSCLSMRLVTKWRDLVELKFYHVSKNFIWPRKVCNAITFSLRSIFLKFCILKVCLVIYCNILNF